jgi:hypothetical protein
MTVSNIATVSYTASPTLQKFHNSPAFVRGVRGPVGSGKSVGCCFELFRLACLQAPNKQKVRKSRAIVVRNTLPELFSTTIKTWKDWFPPGDPRKDPTKFGEFTGRPPYTHFVKYNMPDGTFVDLEVIFLALDQADDAKKLLSLEASFFWINEAREILKEIIDAATGRAGRYPSAKEGGCSRPAIIMDTNPPDDAHWWHDAAEESDEPDWEFWSQPSGLSAEAENVENLLQTEETIAWTAPSETEIFRLREAGYSNDSPEIQEQLKAYRAGMQKRREWGQKTYYSRISQNKSQEWIDVYVHGEYGFIKKGVPVYASCWNKDIHVHKNPVPIRPRSTIGIGIDCSGRHPAAAFWQPTPRGHWDMVAELCVTEKEGMGAKRFAGLLVQFIQLNFPENDILNPLWGDPAGASQSQNDENSYIDILNKELKRLLAKRGQRLKVKPSPGYRWPERYESVEHMLSTLIDGRPMFMVSPTCKVTIRGFNGGYMYRQISTAGDIRFDERPLKNTFADIHDAIQYLACGIGALWGFFKTSSKGTGQVRSVAQGGSVW